MLNSKTLYISGRKSHIHLVDNLPATASGKILKHQLKQQAEAL
jgi:acyl-coenzyme A synthetase/AMP-(fatty) acid ligase